MITESAFGKLKGYITQCILSRKCKIWKESVQNMGMSSLVLHNVWIELDDMIPGNWDMGVDHATNKRRLQNEIWDV